MEIREEVTEDELLEILNSELYKHAELKKCSFLSIQAGQNLTARAVTGQPR